MNSILITIAASVAIFVVIRLCYLLLSGRPKRMSPAEEAEYRRTFTERLHRPDFRALETHYGATVPLALRELYSSKAELARVGFEVASRIDADDEDRWFIANYQPADAEALKPFWRGTERYFAFASDGAGNEYLIDPRLPDPPVQFHDHETGDLDPVCGSLTEFLTWPRLVTSEE